MGRPFLFDNDFELPISKVMKIPAWDFIAPGVSRVT
jgi:hypothetical protein